MEKNNFFIKRIRELANISYQRDIATFSDFLNLNEQNLIKMERFPGDTRSRVMTMQNVLSPPFIRRQWTMNGHIPLAA